MMDFAKKFLCVSCMVVVAGVVLLFGVEPPRLTSDAAAQDTAYPAPATAIVPPPAMPTIPQGLRPVEICGYNRYYELQCIELLSDGSPAVDFSIELGQIAICRK